MKIEELITLAENKLMALNQSIATATAKGDTAALAALETEAAETQATLDDLRTIA